MDLTDLFEMLPLCILPLAGLLLVWLLLTLWCAAERRFLDLDRYTLLNDQLRIQNQRDTLDLALVQTRLGNHEIPLSRQLLEHPHASAQLAVNAIEAGRRKAGDELRSISVTQRAQTSPEANEAELFYERYKHLRL